jgi:hypothetical protein
MPAKFILTEKNTNQPERRDNREKNIGRRQSLIFDVNRRIYKGKRKNQKKKEGEK